MAALNRPADPPPRAALLERACAPGRPHPGPPREGRTAPARSPWGARELVRELDSIVACEVAPAARKKLMAALRRAPQAGVVDIDGWVGLPAFVPPKERRGVGLIDPPFESAAEFHDQARALGEALRRFATGIYLLWFPIKSVGEANAFCGEVLATGVKRALRIDIDIGAEARAIGAKDRLPAAGLGPGAGSRRLQRRPRRGRVVPVEVVRGAGRSPGPSAPPRSSPAKCNDISRGLASAPQTRRIR